ncbi:MAG: hypothetical protein ACRCSI_05125, partial [Eubacterium aggregans]
MEKAEYICQKIDLLKARYPGMKPLPVHFNQFSFLVNTFFFLALAMGHQTNVRWSQMLRPQDGQASSHEVSSFPLDSLLVVETDFPAVSHLMRLEKQLQFFLSIGRMYTRGLQYYNHGPPWCSQPNSFPSSILVLLVPQIMNSSLFFDPGLDDQGLAVPENHSGCPGSHHASLNLCFPRQYRGPLATLSPLNSFSACS